MPLNCNSLPTNMDIIALRLSLHVRRNWVFELAREADNPLGRTQITVEGRVLQLAQRGYALKGVSEH
jgi:hypothetical protein